MLKRALSLIIIAGIFLFLVFSPELIANGINKNIFRIKAEREKASYRGNIVFWHVVSFKTGEGSGYSLLKARCSNFEKGTPYVFVDIKGITAKEAAERLERGERPDVISFPYGFLDQSALCGIEKSEIVSPLFKNTQQGAIPYMFDSYVIVLNKKILRLNGIEPPYDGRMTSQLFNEILAADIKDEDGKAVAKLAFGDSCGENPEKTLEYFRFSDEDTYTLAELAFGGSECGPASLNNEAAMYICPYSEYKKLQTDNNMDAECFPVSDYTDLIQMVGVFDSGNLAKNEMSKKLAGSLLRTGFQRQLEELEMFPVYEVPGIYESSVDRREQFERLINSGVFPKG